MRSDKFAVFIVAIVMTLALAGAVDADESRDLKQTDKHGDAERGIPVPEEAKWEHKTFSADKSLFAIYFRSGWDEVISIHDAASGKQLRFITDHGDEVVEFKFSDDGKLLASRCINSGRKGWALWDVATGKLLLRLPESKASE